MQLLIVNVYIHA